jgi:hypothetical protein
MSPPEPAMPDLPEPVASAIAAFVAGAQAAFGDGLRSVVLYGSAAEGRLRASSDVNLIVVVAGFDAARADALRESLRTAYAAVRLRAMVLVEDEVGPAMEAFAVKFADVLHRRRVLVGKDPFAECTPSRAAELARLEQVLLNFVLRARQSYLLRSLREEQLVPVIADAAGPLRASAVTLLRLEQAAVPPGREALLTVAASLAGGDYAAAVARISEAREQGTLPPGVAGPALLRLSELATAMRVRAQALRAGP